MSEEENLRKQLEQKKKEYEEAKKRFNTLKKTVRKNYEGVVQLLTEVISLSDRFLGGHLKRCAEITKAFNSHLRHPKDVIFLHYYSALLHDIGLVGKDSSIITLPKEKLDESQWEAFQSHPLEGEKIIGSIYNLKRTAAIVRAHHERYDGSGFPDRLVANEIPYGARVLGIVNDWDILKYKHRLSQDETLEYIEKNSGTLYDPKLADSFLPFIKEFKKSQDNEVKEVSLEELSAGMYIQEDVILSNGLLLVPHGVVLDSPTINKIHSFSSMLGERKRFQVVY